MKTYPLDKEEVTQDVNYVIFLIPGNPGLINYYVPFLDALSSQLRGRPCNNDASAQTSQRKYWVTGTSLAGFETVSALPTGTRDDIPYGLQQQIELVEGQLETIVATSERENGPDGGMVGNSTPKQTNVILVGHSVGAYILMEVLRRHREAAAARGENQAMRIAGGILLFPTITHIAKSPSGIWLTRLLRVPSFPLIAGTLVRVLVYLIPPFVFYLFVRVILRFPPHAALTTAKFIKSPLGVQQALHLAKDEMEQITEDKWDEDIWGGPDDEARRNSNSGTVEGAARLSLYFGENDHWVSNLTRDKFIAARKGKESNSWGPRIVIDQGGLPHGFCIGHSEQVARIAAGLIEDTTDAWDYRLDASRRAK
ncbi:MAG: hypothetical protein M1837_000652 [Sclerophora amabilis]|nr:MAG: hypothetical protein M1837_000652 [Sclerophora amabilis]